jgi:hypothetical protein
MKYILILLLSLSLTKAQALEPSSEKGVSNDTFINYQWALENNGQKLSRDTDDIHPILVESKVGFDIQWKKLQEILKTKVRKETVVAVIDSGISASHDDIKNNVLPGRNFMSDSPRFINDVSDDLGHGTHVAGIIAAEINNSKGISGVADKIKILPLKVYSSGKETEQRSFIERVAKAILFAVDKKVDVINLSLGWPLIIDLPIVKTAIQKALDQNITIVAGAGNDGHALKVLPCSYKEVICVGAIGINGDIPNFSNHGGQVDILAPGEEILSLWPALLLPKNFGLRKYNVVSGTSQATPYVSAAVAVLKSVFPNITSDEIKARLFASSKNDLNWGNKFALNGLVQMASAIEIKPQTVIRPVFKELDQIYINPYDKKFSIDLPIKNYWKASGPVQIQISSLNSNVSFVNRSYSLEKINSQDEISIHVRGYVHDLLKDNSLRFSVSIHHDGKEETYTHESTLSLRTEQIRGLKAYKNISNVKSVLDFEDFNEDAEFYSQSKTDKGIEVSVYRFEGGELIARDPMFIPNATDLYPYFGVVRVDMDFDGVSDYFISAIVKENKEVHIKHFIFNKNLTAKYNQLSEWDFKDEGVLIHQPSVDFVKWNSRELGAVAVPIFWSKGKIPEMDQNPDPFERQSSIDKGLYYLIPLVENGKITLRTRLLNSDANVAQIRKKINARFDE